jgi:excisionase family DNA binding protein
MTDKRIVGDRTAEPEAGRLLNIHELSAYLNIPVRTLYQMAGEGTIPATKIGKHWRFRRDSIDRWLRRRTAAGRATLLVVDDDPMIGQLFEDVFSDDGYLVTSTTDPGAALQLIRDREFSVAFLDVVMPGITGGALLAEIKRIRPTQPLILMTAYPDSELVAQALALGPVTLVQKPFSIHHLRALVQGMIPE